MSVEKLDKKEINYFNEDRVATQKDLRILSLELEHKILNVKIELENKINSVIVKLGSLIIGCSTILFGLLTYFHN